VTASVFVGFSQWLISRTLCLLSPSLNFELNPARMPSLVTGVVSLYE
jgi:hypothetical protein